MTDLTGGQIPVAIDTVSASRTFIASVRLKAPGVTSLKGSALLPEIRTVAAQGFEGLQVIAWNGLYAPRGTPPVVVQKTERRAGQDPRTAEGAPAPAGTGA